MHSSYIIKKGNIVVEGIMTMPRFQGAIFKSLRAREELNNYNSLTLIRSTIFFIIIIIARKINLGVTKSTFIYLYLYDKMAVKKISVHEKGLGFFSPRMKTRRG